MQARQGKGDGGPPLPAGAVAGPAGGAAEGEVGRWQVRRRRGTASELHAAAHPEPRTSPRPLVVLAEVTAPALVLGSTQHDSVVDEARARAAGVEVVRRRTGGGAVLVGPGDPLWIDVVIPAGDPRWSPDVGRAFSWVGEVWREALARLGLAGLECHQGPLRRTRWSALVCFAGLGPGEITSGGTKLVGLCQRRTREATLFQGAGLGSWDPGLLVDLLALDPPERAAARRELAGAAAGIGRPLPEVEAAFLEALARW